MKRESHAEFLHDLHCHDVAIQYKDQKWFLECGCIHFLDSVADEPHIASDDPSTWPVPREVGDRPHIYVTNVFGLTPNVEDKEFTYTGRTGEECFRNFINGFRELDGRTIFEAEPDLEIVQPTAQLEDID